MPDAGTQDSPGGTGLPRLAAALALLGLAASTLRRRQLKLGIRELLGRLRGYTPDASPVPIDTGHMPPELDALARAMNRQAEDIHAAYDQVSLSLARQRQLRRELQAMAQRLLDVQEDERRTLSRELHDDVGQAITAIKLGASALADDPDQDPALRQEVLAEIVATADQTVAKLRDLSLLLRPPQLDSLGLEPALRSQVAALARKSRTRIVLEVAPLSERPPAAVELACFRIAQEALTNALRHAGASEVSIEVSAGTGALELAVRDDGRGCTPAPGMIGLGMVTMRERALQVGGSLAVDSTPGAGTTVRAHLPYVPPDDEATAARAQA